MIPAKKLERHLFLSNFNLGTYDKEKNSLRGDSMAVHQEQRGFDLSKHRKDTILQNCADSELGIYILEHTMDIIPTKNICTNNFILKTTYNKLIPILILIICLIINTTSYPNLSIFYCFN